ncbi:MAG: LPS export ABC transporter permease LptG, partial [Gammaproteobacteria bacterium]
RASGISIMRIVRSVLQAGLLVVVMVALIGEFIVPGSERQAQSIRAVALKQNISLGQHGFWAKDSQLFFNVGRVYPDYQLGNLEIYELDENKQLKQLIYARSAHYKNGGWLLKNVQRTQLQGDSIISDHLKTLEWPRVLNPDLFNVVSVKPTTMSAIDLYRYSNYLRTNDLDASHYQLAFWIKVMTPLSSMVMLLIALPFVFGSQRSTGSGYRVLVGLLLGIGFFMLNRTVNHLGQIYGLHPFVSASAPVILVAIAGMFALRKVR